MSERIVVVGADGTTASVRALAWALRHALETDAAVHVVTAWPVHSPVFVTEIPGHFNEARWLGSQALERTISRAQGLVATDVPVTRILVNAVPLEALVESTATASMLVIGTDRADPALADQDLGPVRPARFSVRVRDAARCPVVLVPPVGGSPVPKSLPAGAIRV